MSPLVGFEWVQSMSQFSKDLIKNYNENGDEGFFSSRWCLISWKFTELSLWFTLLGIIQIKQKKLIIIFNLSF